mmetsp:Transcript_38239/g.89789  ORF Transcript_38239/g.89789 Transcript_38239/m.89789 type:complete len:216 (-) Transcript_38239:24-671(-)
MFSRNTLNEVHPQECPPVFSCRGGKDDGKQNQPPNCAGHSRHGHNRETQDLRCSLKAQGNEAEAKGEQAIGNGRIAHERPQPGVLDSVGDDGCHVDCTRTMQHPNLKACRRSIPELRQIVVCPGCRHDDATDEGHQENVGRVRPRTHSQVLGKLIEGWPRTAASRLVPLQAKETAGLWLSIALLFLLRQHLRRCVSRAQCVLVQDVFTLHGSSLF